MTLRRRAGPIALGAMAALLLWVPAAPLFPAAAAERPQAPAIPETLDDGHRVEFTTAARSPKKWPNDPAPIDGYLYRPHGAGPFPAVVFLHGAGGFRRSFGALYRNWVVRLVGWGYVVLLADSFEARGIQRVRGASRLVHPRFERPKDAYGALQYLRGLPDVNPDRIGLMGWSHGGWTVLHTVDSAAVVSLPASGVRFRAAVAFYPWCGDHQDRGILPYTPLLILIGAADDWTQAVRCRGMAAKSDGKGGTLSLKVYPGAYHAFDANMAPTNVRGHHLEHNPAAERDAVERVRAFLRDNL